MERIPEGERLEPPGCRTREAHGDLHRIRAAGGEEAFGQPTRRYLPELFRELDGALAGVATRREGQFIHRTRDRRLHTRVAVSDMVDVVAMEIHVTPPLAIPDMDALGASDDVEAGCRNRLAQEMARILRERVSRWFIKPRGLPARPARGEIGIALGLPDAHRFRQAWKRAKTRRSSARCRSFTVMAVKTMQVAIAAAAATAPISSMWTMAMEASFVVGP